MTRVAILVACALVGAALNVPTRADDPPSKLTPDEWDRLSAKRDELNTAALEAYKAGKYPEAIRALEQAVELARRLYPPAEFPKGSRILANHLHDLAYLYISRERLADAEPPLKEALAMRRRLYDGDHAAVADCANNLAYLYEGLGKLADAEPLYRDALAMRRRLYTGDHNDVAMNLNNLGVLLQARGQFAAAEPLLKDALEMRRRLYRGKDHPAVALSLNNLAVLYQAQGRWAAAEPLYRDALAARKRLYKGDHPDVVTSLNNLAMLLDSQGKPAEAERLYEQALGMSGRVVEGDHPSKAFVMSNLAALYHAQGNIAAAGPLLKDALEMRRRLYKGDHPQVAAGLNNLAALRSAEGQSAAAEALYRDALEMRRRLYKGDHPDVADSLSNVAILLDEQGKAADAMTLYRQALAMRRRVVASYAAQKPEGEVLTLLPTFPLTADNFLSLARRADVAPPGVYSELWASKGLVARVYEQRHLRARAAADPAVTRALAELADARRRRAELLLGPATSDPATAKGRTAEIEALERVIATRTEALPARLPAVARADKLQAATVADLQRALPADAAVVDFVRYTLFTRDRAAPGGANEKRTPCYLAFVVTREKVVRLDLAEAAAVEPAVAAWRGAITSGHSVPPAIPAKVRGLVWEKVRKELPAGTKTVHICPDAALCGLPFAALPGDKPDSVLLDDYAVATIPHAPFLLDKLWPQDTFKNPSSGALVVGGVRYDADSVLPAPNPDTVAGRGDPLLKPDQMLGWSFLGNTVGEANGIAVAAERRKLLVTRFEGDRATATAVVATLPKAKYAHFATHGFFADASFRSAFQLDEKDYQKAAWGERVGRAVNSPLLMTGLVFAGANDPQTPGRGIVTGEQLIDLDLSGLELAVLSACETGLGDQGLPGGGEGVFGLQRAFHYAGARNVVCSLWKVPDESTAALMNIFYRNLWDKNLSPMESLRQAQLEIYRNPQKIAALAKGFRGKFEVVPGMGGEVEIKPAKDGTAHPLLWAAFTLSGPGR